MCRAAPLALLLLVAASACAPADPGFSCHGDAQCVRRDGHQSGVCEPTGFCSFPDASCAEGRRYAEHAAELARRCVTSDVLHACADDACPSGRCEALGYCSRADGGCASGYRYASGGLAGACVEVDAPTVVCPSADCGGGRCETSGRCSVEDGGCASGRRYAASAGLLAELCAEAPALALSATVAPATLELGDLADVTVRVENHGGVAAGSIDVELVAADGARSAARCGDGAAPVVMPAGDVVPCLRSFAPDRLGSFRVDASIGAATGGVLARATSLASFIVQDARGHDFELDHEGFVAEAYSGSGAARIEGPTSAARVSAPVWRGQGALSVTYTVPPPVASGAESTVAVFVTGDVVPPGGRVGAQLYVGVDTALVAAELFLVEEGGRRSTVAAPLARDAWSALEVEVPVDATAPLASLGVLLTFSRATTGTLYLDAVDW